MPSSLTGLKQKIWDGSINVKVTLNPRDSNEQTSIHHFYLNVRRDSYIQLCLPVILHHFKPHMLVPEWAEKLTQWWFECSDEDGVPIKWNYPIGLSYDMITGERRVAASVWELTLSLRDYPKEYVIPVTVGTAPEREEDAERDQFGFLHDYWINQLKQACFIIHGSAKPVMSLSKDDTVKALQGGVKLQDLAMFQSVLDLFVPSQVSKFRNIPIRLYLPISANNVLQPVINPLDSKTVGDMLQDSIPELFLIDDDVYKIAYPVVHGIEIPKDTPLVDAYRLFSYVDAFLHVTIVIR